MIASLPMYARPQNRAAHDALWALIRDGLRDRGLAAPDGLDHDIDHIEGWGRPDLVLGQICNLPYRARFRDRVTLIGAAHYDLPDCAPGQYYSVLIARADLADPSAARFACNDLLSNSGYGAAYEWAQHSGFALTPSMITGSHRASMAAVASGQADLAAIDAQTWWIAAQEDGLTDGLHIIGQTAPSPGMSFITRPGQDPFPYFAALDDAIHRLDLAHRRMLNLCGIVALSQTAYDLPLPPMPQAIDI